MWRTLALAALFAAPLVAGEARAESGPQVPRPAVRPKTDPSRIEALRALAKRVGTSPAAKQAAKPGEVKAPACEGITLGQKAGPLPFQPGEELAYEVTVGGLYVGRFETKVGKPRTVDGKSVISLFGRARTNAILSTFQRFEGRYMTLVDPGTLRPIGLQVDSVYGEDRRWEKARFTRGEKKVDASFLLQGRESSRSYERGFPLTDVLTMLYFARTRDIPMGVETCQEVFGQRWLWRMTARVAGVESVDTPVGARDAIKVSTTFVRSEHPDLAGPNKTQRIEMDVFLAKDASQAPLAFTIHTEKITADVKLVRWSLKDDGESWEL